MLCSRVPEQRNDCMHAASFSLRNFLDAKQTDHTVFISVSADL